MRPFLTIVNRFIFKLLKSERGEYHSFTSYFQEMPVQLCTSVLLQYLVLILLRITSALPSIPNPDNKAAFDQILQANLEIERDCKFFF